MSDDGRDRRGRFLPGVSGNPRGKPKGRRSLCQDLYKVLGEVATGGELEVMFDKLGIPADLRAEIEIAENRQEAFARALVFQALAHGHWSAISEVFGRLDPMPSRVELSGRGGGPIATAGLSGDVDPEDARKLYESMVRGGDADPDTEDE